MVFIFKQHRLPENLFDDPYNESLIRRPCEEGKQRDGGDNPRCTRYAVVDGAVCTFFCYCIYYIFCVIYVFLPIFTYFVAVLN